MARKKEIRLKPVRAPHGLFPIFILGIERRTGTNFLQNLLALHPDCRKFPLQEDGFVRSSGLLRSFAENIASLDEWSWHPSTPEVLLQSLGRGLEELIRSQDPGRHLLLKTPSCRGIRDFFALFQGSRLIILVRDGRDTVESHMRTWKSEMRDVLRDWGSSAKELIEFLREHGKDRRVLVVRYEDVFLDRERELRRILKYLSLSPAKFDFETAAKLPVIGSSSYRGRRDPWKHPKAVSASFQPLGKHAGWTAAQARLYNRMVGKYARQLGYPPA